MSKNRQLELFPELEKERLLNEEQAASFLGVEVKTLQYWRWKDGGPQFVKLGRLVRYEQASLADFVQQNLKANTSN